MTPAVALANFFWLPQFQIGFVRSISAIRSKLIKTSGAIKTPWKQSMARSSWSPRKLALGFIIFYIRSWDHRTISKKRMLCHIFFPRFVIQKLEAVEIILGEFW